MAMVGLRFYSTRNGNFNGNTSVWNVTAGNFGTLLSNTNALKTVTLATNSFSKPTVSIYPNPSNGTLRIKADNSVSVELVDVLGEAFLKCKQRHTIIINCLYFT